ncbi:MAG: histidine--tRNA ligase, partial [Candidatus Binatia bacterium]
FGAYGFDEIRLPIAERTELFARAAGETSDIVEKQMYTFADLDGASLTLRPEGTASVVRAYVEHGIHGREPVSKLYYLGPMFRRERPQKGRLRQFHQIGAEVIGREDPLADAELMVWLADFFAAIGLRSYRLEINSLGCSDCRPAYRELLRAYGEARRDTLCPDCVRRLATNPLRILDCKIDGPKLADAPVMVDHLDEACARHFERVRAVLDAEGVGATLAPRMVRGLDYYCRTAFEVSAEGLGSQNAVGGGGRYDGLVADLGGPKMAGVGFALGVERLVLALHREAAVAKPDLFVAPLGTTAELRGFSLARRLRALGLRVEIESGEKSLKSHMRRADRLAARAVLIVGDDELGRGVGILRDLDTKEQREVILDAAAIRRAIPAAEQRREP